MCMRSHLVLAVDDDGVLLDDRHLVEQLEHRRVLIYVSGYRHLQVTPIDTFTADDLGIDVWGGGMVVQVC